MSVAALAWCAVLATLALAIAGVLITSGVMHLS